MKFSRFNPTGKMCVIKVYEGADKSASGILLNNDSNTSAGKVLGTIVEAGPESSFVDKVGRIAFFRRYSFDELKYITEAGEQTVYLVDSDEILALPELSPGESI